MATYTKVKLSGDTSGEGIYVGTDPVTIHSTGTSSGILDEIWLYVVNQDVSSAQSCTVYVGSNSFTVLIQPTSGLMLILPGIIISGNGTVATSVSAAALTSGQMIAYGYVNRITP